MDIARCVSGAAQAGPVSHWGFSFAKDGSRRSYKASATGLGVEAAHGAGVRPVASAEAAHGVARTTGG
jgi:uncharacterized spore protein YtfJ